VLALMVIRRRDHHAERRLLIVHQHESRRAFSLATFDDQFAPFFFRAKPPVGDELLPVDPTEFVDLGFWGGSVYQNGGKPRSRRRTNPRSATRNWKTPQHSAIPEPGRRASHPMAVIVASEQRPAASSPRITCRHVDGPTKRAI
jgi:hypothetical protein